ncbi:MAG: fructose-bisphosphate aldolase [Deltaproteobacteria bacterium]|nr:fructose-bisphosphate aldolase [Deltaproteobacteria bacterium]
MSTGKKFRLGRLIKNGKMFCIPLDHGVTHGPIGHLNDIDFAIKAVLDGGGSSIVLHKGITKSVQIPKDLGLIIHISASTILSTDYNRKTIVTSVEEVLALGADGVSIHINIGSKYEHEMLRDLGIIAKECDRFSLPLMAMTYVRPTIDGEIKNPAIIAHAARVASELGADIVKVSYPGNSEAVNQVVSSCTQPIVIAGGECTPSIEEALKIAEQSMKGGALGISFGRNVFQRQNMLQMVKSLSSIVYDGLTLTAGSSY